MRAQALIRSLRSPLKRAFLWARPLSADALFFAGLLVVAIGVGMIYRPAGVIVAGGSLSAVVFLVVRR